MSDIRVSRIARLLERLLLHYSVSTTVDGLWIGTFESRKNAEPLLRRVTDALQLIKTYDPLRYKRVLQELERICVRLQPSSIACYLAHRKSCDIDPRYVLSYTPQQLASVIVHEATHGVLRRRHIGYEEALRERVERACVRQELAFARKLPHSEAVQESVERALGYPQEMWTDSAFRDRYREGMLTMARHIGIPVWLMRAMLNLRQYKAPGTSKV
jgi:hypothetical protein